MYNNYNPNHELTAWQPGAQRQQQPSGQGGKPNFGYLAPPRQSESSPSQKSYVKPDPTGYVKKKSSYGPIPRATQSPVHRRRKLKRNLFLVFVGVFFLVAMASAVFVTLGDEVAEFLGIGSEDSPITPSSNVSLSPTTNPTTSTPTTSAPTTSAPTTSAPTTSAPTTSAPTTSAPTTSAPTTSAPTTSAPTTSAPTTSAPTTSAPTTSAPTTSAPTTSAPTTSAPTTSAPTTSAPTTSAPTTSAPTTSAPTTSSPTTSAPTTSAPTTSAPTTSAPTTSAPTTEAPIQVFPEETRNGNNYVGIMFLNPPNQATEDAFLGAADRWSDILAGSENLMENNILPAGFETCNGNGNVIDSNIVLDHLRITADVVPIDGNFGVVGRAGPCRFTSGAIPTFGNMEFDSADIDRMAAEGSLESVILHEMGHVLGIGTLWRFFGLSQNELANSQPDLNAIQPTYVGANGVAEYNVLTGRNVNSILIENGFTNGAPNGAGPGSVNGHWDQDDMGVELMTFRIQVRTPALSAVTIQSLLDFGYTVDVSQADAFSNPVNFIVDPAEAVNEALVGDIIDPTEFLD